MWHVKDEEPNGWYRTGPGQDDKNMFPSVYFYLIFFFNQLNVCWFIISPVCYFVSWSFFLLLLLLLNARQKHITDSKLSIHMQSTLNECVQFVGKSFGSYVLVYNNNNNVYRLLVIRLVCKENRFACLLWFVGKQTKDQLAANLIHLGPTMKMIIKCDEDNIVLSMKN